MEKWGWPVFEGYERFCNLIESPCHLGLNLCCGTTAQGLNDPKTELVPLLKHLVERKKIFNVHFRNITGVLHNFSEVWPDEGDVDMFVSQCPPHVDVFVTFLQ